jgi:hypothetical protein
VTFGWEIDAGLPGCLEEELVRHLNKDAGAVARVNFRAAGAAVIEIRQNLQALLEDLVRLAALDIDDEADAAGVVFEPRIIQALFAGTSVLLAAPDCAAGRVL